MSRPFRHWTVPIAGGLLALGAAAPVAATDLFVKPSGNGSACTQASPCSLSTAIATAGFDDAVYVAAGTYTGSGAEVVFLDKTIRLLGGWDGAASGAVKRDRIAYPSILDGQNARRVVTITGSGSANPTIDGFTITRGNATGAITSCAAHGVGWPAGCGGGIFVYDAGPTISNNFITSNVAAAAGNAYGGGIFAAEPSGLVVHHNTIAGNTAAATGRGLGGGIGVDSCVSDCRVESNRIVDNVAGTAETANSYGGGLAIAGFSDHAVVVAENVFLGNRGSTAENAASGDEIDVFAAAFAIRRNCIRTSHSGGAVTLSHVNGSFEANTVHGGARGNVVAVSGGRAEGDWIAVRNNIIHGGKSATLEIVKTETVPLVAVVDHNTIVGDGTTSGIGIHENVTANLANNIVTGHATGILVDGGAAATVDHTLFWYNTDDGLAGNAAFSGDPMFVNAPRGDFHISPGSAAIGAAVDVSLAVDIDGEARPGAGAYDIGADEVAPRLFDFGTAVSPVATGYTQVTNTTAYSAARGYGWLSGTISSRDRATGSDLTRDFNFTPLGTFVVDVPNGRYTVSVTMGDATAGHGQMGVFIEGVQVASVTAAGNEFKTISSDVSVGDGQLTVLLDDLGGSDPNVVINALAIGKALPIRLDLGTTSSPLAAGYSRVSHASTYSQAAGSGWRGGIIQSRDRGTTDPLRRDLNFTSLGLFGIFLQNGLYDLSATLGDATGAHDQMGVSVQGAAFDSITTAKNQFVTRTWRTCVCDNGLGTLLDDLGGADANVVVNAIEVREPPLLYFDFGTPTSPVAAGYLQVAHGSVYSASAGHGWLSGTIGSRDRGAYGELLRDFNFTTDGTFVVDVLPGRYTVTVTMGDATVAHDQMGLYVEGTLWNTVTVPAGSFATLSQSVTVSDGQLTVRLADLGGSDPNAVINRLEIR